jgi:hypothetical protein
LTERSWRPGFRTKEAEGHRRSRGRAGKHGACALVNPDDSRALLVSLFCHCSVDLRPGTPGGDLKPDSRERLCSWQFFPIKSL